MFLETIPDTTSYMVGGYAFAFLAMAIYLISLVVRSRNLNRDLSTLESLERENQAREARATKKK